VELVPATCAIGRERKGGKAEWVGEARTMPEFALEWTHVESTCNLLGSAKGLSPLTSLQFTRKVQKNKHE